METTNEGLESLTGMFKNCDWFCETGLDNIGRYVVYVKYMNMEVMTSVPDTMLGKQVLIHFIGSKTARRENFTNTISTSNVVPVVAPTPAPLEEPDVLAPEYSESNIAELLKELDRLEKICGSNALQDIFYEIHDGKNAVTNLSDRYPLVKEGLMDLYDRYGFDVIYEELDG